MIFNVFFELVNTLLQAVLGILPNLPDLPTAFTDVMAIFLGYIRVGFRFIVYFAGGDFVKVIFPLLAFLLNFRWIYHLTMWVIKKLPIGAQ